MISGGIKFYEENEASIKKEATATATTNPEYAEYMLTDDLTTRWESGPSDDATVETIEVRFQTVVSINRLFLIEHNFKSVLIEYDAAGMWQIPTHVIGINGDHRFFLKTALNQFLTDDSGRYLFCGPELYPSTYCEFDTVVTSKIRLTVEKTQIPNSTKYLTRFVATNEIGTLQGYPAITNLMHTRQTHGLKTPSGKFNVNYGKKRCSFDLEFAPCQNQDDLTLIETLFERNSAFMVWLCGGRTGEVYFPRKFSGFDLRDLYTMKIVSDLSAGYTGDIYLNGVNMTVSFVESV